ncbi:MAG: rod shape-determining protein RodA [Lachnospiraceae bacterium]|nr:rod shape-determining protein RodA [Lachnospiraceae bacterium]
MPFKKFKIRDYDFKLIIMVALIAVIGVFAVGSAEPSLFRKQMYGAIAGFIIMIILSFIDYHFILKFYWIMYIVNLILLVLVLFAGESSNNAQRWLKIGSIKFQPSELAKILLILFFAQFIMILGEKFNTFPAIMLCTVLMGVPIVLVLRQPDLSTTIIMTIIFAAVMFAGKLKFRIIVGILAVIIPAAAIFVSIALRPDSGLLKDYQMERLYAFQDPESYPEIVYQQENSVTAIASGMLDGKGYRNNEITSVKNGNFLDEDQTDFIFAIIGEEFGFKGSLVVILLLIFIALECVSAGRMAPDCPGTVIGCGMGALIGFQSFINIGVATFILPNTGLPLPFVSYGLTSLLTLFFGMGIVLNVRTQAKRGTSADEYINFANI